MRWFDLLFPKDDMEFPNATEDEGGMKISQVNRMNKKHDLETSIFN